MGSISTGFDFEGTFTRIEANSRIEYALDDDRRVAIRFVASGNAVTVRETFDAENELSAEQQKQGWQSILNNFKTYVESNGT